MFFMPNHFWMFLFLLYFQAPFVLSSTVCLVYLHIRSVSPTLIQVLHIFNASSQGYWICYSLWIIIVNTNGLRSNVFFQKAFSSILFFLCFSYGIWRNDEYIHIQTFLSLEEFTLFYFYCNHKQNIHRAHPKTEFLNNSTLCRYEY